MIVSIEKRGPKISQQKSADFFGHLNSSAKAFSDCKKTWKNFWKCFSNFLKWSKRSWGKNPLELMFEKKQ